LKEHGIELTKHQEKKMILQLQEHGLEEFTFEPNRQQKTLLKKLGSDSLVLDFQQTDLDALQSKIFDAASHAGIETAKWLSEKLSESWQRQSKTILKKIRSERREFINYHGKIWGKPLDLLDALISISLELGNETSLKSEPISDNKDNIVFHTIKRLHARGCQVSSEILTLLRGGFSDGAHARWRTLHEISVVAQFLSTNNAELTERYLAHSAIVDYQRALQYQKHSDSLSYAPLLYDEFAKIKANYDMVKDKYGKGFKNTDWFRNDYWWASIVLNNPHPNLANIEERVEVSFMQPFVKLAHVNVHAGSAGIFLRLGSPPNNDVLVAGASVFGVWEPGQNTAYTICNLTSTLLLYKSDNLEDIGSALALRKFTEETVQEFDYAMEEQEKANHK
jgi:hypothetical protein